MEDSFSVTELMSVNVTFDSKSVYDFRDKMRSNKNREELYDCLVNQFTARALRKGYTFIERKDLSSKQKKALKRQFDKLINKSNDVQNIIISVQNQPLARRLPRRSTGYPVGETDNFEQDFADSLEMSKLTFQQVYFCMLLFMPSGTCFA